MATIITIDGQNHNMPTHAPERRADVDAGTTMRSNRAALMPAGGSKDAVSRLGRFAGWLDEQGRDWRAPDLAAYRDDLAAGYEAYDPDRGEIVTYQPLKASSVKAHLSTVRGRYAELLKDDQTRDEVMSTAATRLPAGASVADILALGNEALTRLQNALDPKRALVKVEKKQDRTDREHLRLTVPQANTLLAAPGVNTVKGLRDTAIIAVMLCTGIREQELCNLEVLDLRQKVDGKLALHVREGKGAKTRLVPYGALDWCLVIVDRWLDVAGIIEGPVFRAVSKAGAVLSGNLTTRAIQQITAGYTRDGQHIGGYPIPVDSELCYARPHDLRRTYARRLYDAGVAVKAIQENLGHASQETTLGYIGDLDFDQRQPPAVYTFDLSVLRHAPAAQRRSEEIER